MFHRCTSLMEWTRCRCNHKVQQFKSSSSLYFCSVFVFSLSLSAWCVPVPALLVKSITVLGSISHHSQHVQVAPKRRHGSGGFAVNQQQTSSRLAEQEAEAIQAIEAQIQMITQWIQELQQGVHDGQVRRKWLPQLVRQRQGRPGHLTSDLSESSAVHGKTMRWNPPRSQPDDNQALHVSWWTSRSRGRSSRTRSAPQVRNQVGATVMGWKAGAVIDFRDFPRGSVGNRTQESSGDEGKACMTELALEELRA